jgi:hypothetical protein
VADAKGATYSSVSTNLVVPALTDCTSAAEDTYSAFWAGLDGLGSSTVEQTGILADCSAGVVTYVPWYESYPSGATEFPDVTLSAGDTVHAAVSAQGNGNYLVSLTDLTSGSSDSTVVVGPNAASLSAECVSEDPFLLDGSTAPYAHFTPVAFSGCDVDGAPIGATTPDLLTTLAVNGPVEAIASGLINGTNFSVSRVTPTGAPGVQTPVVGIAATPLGDGYWIADALGNIETDGTAQYYGSLASMHLNKPISHIVATPDGHGYWLMASDGGIFCFGDAGFYGSMGAAHLNAPVVGMASTSTGKGYWLVASDGGIFSFGDAAFYGSMGAAHLNQPVVGMASAAGTGGYWLVASDGGIFSFHAPFFGSSGALKLNQPIVAMAVSPDARGYWLAAADGGLFTYGDAQFHGSLATAPNENSLVGIAVDYSTGGYWLLESNYGICGFDAPWAYSESD